MPYYSPKDSYNRYALLRWWCQNQWWVQIVVPCVICAGVIGALLYQWNNEHQRQVQDKIFETQYGYMKEHPPELDPDLDEKAAAWRVIRMKKNDPSMPIPYKKKQLIVKHWKSIIVDMKAEEIQRLHDLLQDQPVKPTDDIEIDIRKFEAPWKDDVTLDDMDAELAKTTQMEEDIPDPVKNLPDEESASDNPTPSDNLKLPEKDAGSDSSPKDETDGAFQAETPEGSPAPAKKEGSKKAETPAKSASSFPTVKIPEVLEPIFFDSSDESDSAVQDASETYTDIDVMEPGQQKIAKGNNRFSKYVGKAATSELDDVCPLEDNFLQQREEFIKKALEERNRKIEEFKKSQDPYQFIPSPWKRNPLVI